VTITELDLTTEVSIDEPLPCEHPEHSTHFWHEGPGAYLVRSLGCPACGDPGRGLFILCKSAWDHALHGRLYCGVCGHVVPRDQGWRLIEVL
jgi:hypothetical protein